MSAQAIRTEGLRKTYGDVEAVAGVDLAIEYGECFALLGPNGAGKTTCFYSIMGLVKPDSGRILLDQAPAQFLGAPLRKP